MGLSKMHFNVIKLHKTNAEMQLKKKDVGSLGGICIFYFSDEKFKYY